MIQLIADLLRSIWTYVCRKQRPCPLCKQGKISVEELIGDDPALCSYCRKPFLIDWKIDIILHGSLFLISVIGMDTDYLPATLGYFLFAIVILWCFPKHGIIPAWQPIIIAEDKIFL